MAARRTQSNFPACTFCGKRHDEVEKLIAGPDVYICDECVGLCSEIVDEDRANKESLVGMEVASPGDTDATSGRIGTGTAHANPMLPVEARGHYSYIVIGVLLLLFPFFVELPIDPKIGGLLFTATAIAGLFICVKLPRKRAAAAPLDTSYMMRDVSWNFSRSAPEDLESFIEAVSEKQADPARWTPHEGVGGAGPLTIEFHSCWEEDGGAFTRLTLDALASSEWTQGQLIHALHHKLHADFEVSGTIMFKGLMRVAPGHFLLFLGR